MAPYALDSRRHRLTYLPAFRPTRAGAQGKEWTAVAVKGPDARTATAPIRQISKGRQHQETGMCFSMAPNSTLTRAVPHLRIFRNEASFSSTYHSLVKTPKETSRLAQCQSPGKNNSNETRKDPKTYLSKIAEV